MRSPSKGEKPRRIRQVERREWSLSWLAILVTLLLTGGLTSLAVTRLNSPTLIEGVPLTVSVWGLVGLILIVDLYIIYQRLQIQGIRRQLAERDELLALIGDNAADMIAVVNADGTRVYNSPSYQRILGYSPAELTGTTGFEQIHPDDRQLVVEAAAEARGTGTGRTVEYRMRHKDGHWVTLESTASAVLDPQGDVQKLVIVNRDITERKKLETQLHQSQKMDAIGRLSGGVAHDFNNLLGLIIGYAEVLQERIAESDSLRGCVQQILKASSQGASLTRQLLAFSRQQVLAPKALSLNTVIVDVEKMLRRLIGEDVELITDLDPQLGNVRADQGQIEQVILNLAVNARDAMPKGGKLMLKTANAQIDDDMARQHSFPVLTGSYVILTVSDTGTGIDPRIQQKIFEPFFTTKEKGKGTGLGLSTVYGVVKQSGGYIAVESAPGKGAMFTIYLPRVDQPQEQESSEGAPTGSLRGNETILLVEDEDGLRTATRSGLESYGYTVLDAADPDAAIALSHQTPGRIHLLLTDIMMAGTNGKDLADQIRRGRPDTKVLFVSGYTGQRFDEKSWLDPGSHFLQKPFTRQDLARKVRDVLGAPSLTPVHAAD